MWDSSLVGILYDYAVQRSVEGITVRVVDTSTYTSCLTASLENSHS